MELVETLAAVVARCRPSGAGRAQTNWPRAMRQETWPQACAATFGHGRPRLSVWRSAGGRHRLARAFAARRQRRDGRREKRREKIIISEQSLPLRRAAAQRRATRDEALAAQQPRRPSQVPFGPEIRPPRRPNGRAQARGQVLRNKRDFAAGSHPLDKQICLLGARR